MLKLPTLSKLPKHRRFDIVTRFYNPEKEDLQQRIRLAEENLKAQEKEKPKEDENQLSREERIKYALRTQRKHHQKGFKDVFDYTAIIRLGLMVFITFGLWAFVMYGEEILNFFDKNWAVYGLVILGLFVISKLLKK